METGFKSLQLLLKLHTAPQFGKVVIVMLLPCMSSRWSCVLGGGCVKAT